ncbi:MAG: hypothetical protein ABEH78_03750 [Haloferacaceae archaeon]
MTPLQGSVTPVTAVGVARALGYLCVAVAGLGLLRYLRRYTQCLLADPYRTRWRYLAVGIGATVVYGAAGLVEVVGLLPARPFRRGATLFVFLFCAIGVRAVHRSVGGGSLRSDAALRWLGPVGVAGFCAAWWGTHLYAGPRAVATVELLGLTVATAYTLAHAFGTVRAAEGTSVAAFTRHFVPALLALVAVAVAEHVGTLVPPAAPVGEGVALVGRVLVAAFLFTTAVAIRQQGGESERMYDPTTWRDDRLDGPDGTNG